MVSAILLLSLRYLKLIALRSIPSQSRFLEFVAIVIFARHKLERLAKSK